MAIEPPKVAQETPPQEQKVPKVAVNENGGQYRPGAAFPLEKKLEIALKYHEMIDKSEKVTCRSLAAAACCGKSCALKIIQEIKAGTIGVVKEVNRIRGCGSKTLTLQDENTLLTVYYENPKALLKHYQMALFQSNGKVVSTATLSRWFSVRRCAAKRKQMTDDNDAAAAAQEVVMTPDKKKRSKLQATAETDTPTRTCDACAASGGESFFYKKQWNTNDHEQCLCKTCYNAVQLEKCTTRKEDNNSAAIATTAKSDDAKDAKIKRLEKEVGRLQAKVKRLERLLAERDTTSVHPV